MRGNVQDAVLPFKYMQLAVCAGKRLCPTVVENSLVLS